MATGKLLAREFYARWARTAFWHALGPTDLWSGIIGGILGLVDHYRPELHLMGSYGFQILFWVLAIIVAVRLVLAPFWMAQEDDEKLAAATAKLKARDDAIAHTLHVSAVVTSVGVLLSEDVEWYLELTNSGPQPIAYHKLKIEWSLDNSRFRTGKWASDTGLLKSGHSVRYTSGFDNAIVEREGKLQINLEVEYGPVGIAPLRRLNDMLLVSFNRGTIVQSNFHHFTSKEEKIDA